MPPQPSQGTLAARLRTPGYILLVAMSLLPVLDMLLISWPIRAGEVTWRFGTFGQLSATAAAPLVAIVLLYALAYSNGNRGMLYFCIALSVVYAILLLGGLISFPLDVAEMRRRVSDSQLQKFTLASGAAELRLIIYFVGAIALAVSQSRSLRFLGTSSSQPLDPASSLVMKNLGPVRPSSATPTPLPADSSTASAGDSLA